MQRKFIFKDSNKEILLPVTPPNFNMSNGVKIETINIHSLGDVHIAGYKTLASIRIDCMFPARDYTFAYASGDPYSYIEQFTKWSNDREVVRWIVSDTPVNIGVLIESISYSEQDGTNDVYASIALREYRELSATKIESTSSKNIVRASSEPAVKAETYLIKSGDTLSAICRKFYGDAMLYPKLAAANNIKNPHLIYAGHTLKIPDRSQL